MIKVRIVKKWIGVMAGDVSPVAMFLKSRRFEDIKYDTERYVWGIIWGMSGIICLVCRGVRRGK